MNGLWNRTIRRHHARIHPVLLRLLTVLVMLTGLVAPFTQSERVVAAAGSGAMTVSPTSVTASSSGNTLTFTFTNVSNSSAHSISGVTVLVPSGGWTTPQAGTSTNPGYVSTSGFTGSCTSASPTVSSMTITVATTCTTGVTGGFTLSYANVAAQTATGTATFTTATGGTNIGTQPAVTVVNGPTKLAITTISPASPTAGASFSVTVQAQNPSGTATNVIAATAVTLSRATGSGTLGGTLTGTIAAGSNSVTISGVTYTKAESGVSLTATRTSGDMLTAGTSGTFTVVAGTASKVVFGTQPSSTMAGAVITPAVTALIEDANGNVVSSTANVTIAIGTNPGGGVLGGTLTVAAAAGTATFSNLTISKGGAGYVLTATSSGLTSAASSAFNVTATKLAITTISPASPTAGSSFSVTVQAQDPSGTATNVSAATAVTLSLATGSGTLGGTLTGTIAAGASSTTISGVTYTKAESGVSLTATRTSGDLLTAGTSSTFTVVAGTASKVVFGTQPSSTMAGAVIAPAVTVLIEDANGNVVSSTASVTVAIGTNPGGATLGGTKTVNAVAGTATFSTLTVSKGGVGYTLTATSGTLTSATSSAFNVTATKLAITTISPASPTAGSSFSVTVQAQDPSGTATNVSAATGVTLSLATGTGTLGGTLTGTIAAGANSTTISGVTYTKAESGVSLTATRTSGDTLTAGTSSTFTVVAGTASKVVFGTQPSSTMAGAVIAPAVTVLIEDANGNVVSSTASVTVAIGNNPGNGQLGGTKTVNAVAGTATFSTLTIDKGGVGYTLTAASSGLTGATSNPFTISQTTSTTTVSSSGSPSTYGDSVTFTANVTPSSATGTITFMDGSTTLGTGTLAGGQATFSIASLTAGSHSITAAYGGDTSDAPSTSSSINQTVNGAPLTVTADDKSRAYGAADPTFTASFNGFVNGDTAASLTTQPTCGSTATSTSPVGPYPITCSGAVDANYAFTYAAGTLTIGQTTSSTTVSTSGSPSAYGDSVTFTANVTPSSATGTVTFMDGSTTLGDGILSGGVATFSTAVLLVAGSPHAITAVYGGDTNYSGSTSDPVTQDVNQAQTTVALTTLDGLTSYTFLTPVTFVATVSPGAGTGTVTFSNGGTVLCQDVIASSGTATCPDNYFALGDYKITASFSGDANFAAGSSSELDVTVSNGTATQLAFIQQPTTSAPGVAIAPPVVVALEDQFGDIIPDSSASVQLAITSGTGSAGATLSGGDAINFINGVATFSNVSIDMLGTGYTLTATSGTLSGTSQAFDIATAAPSYKLAFTSQPGTATSGQSMGLVTVELQDQLGNPVAGVAGSVTLSIAGDPNGAILSGNTASIDTTTGDATFTSPIITGPAGDYALTATASGDAASATIGPITLSAPPADTLSFCQAPPDARVGDALGVAVCAVDPSTGMTDANFQGSVTLTLQAADGTSTGTLLGTNPETAIGGMAPFGDISVSNVGSYTLTASASGLSDAVSDPFTIAPALVGTTLIVATATGTYGGTATLSATLLASDNPLANKSVEFYLGTTDAGPATTDANGVATLPGVSMAGFAAGYYGNAIDAIFSGDTANAYAENFGDLSVSPADVTITWTAPAAITYGTALDGTQLNATATFGGKDVAGTFVYNPAAGTVLDAGSGQSLAVTFTPTDTQDYNPASGSVEINVGKAPLTVTADNKGITYGDALPAYTGVLLGVVNKDDITAQYASVATGAAGSYPIVPTLVDPDSRLSNYAVTSTEGTLTISMAGVTITWTAPSDIGYGTALDGTQLNATATFSGKDVAGTFVYNPAAGTVLNAGSGQTLAVTFTPTDTQDYNPASGSVEINVGKAPLTVTADNKGITYGDALPAYTGVLLGVVNKDDITAQYASVATGAAGSYPIVPTLVDPDSRLSNYAVTSTEGTLTISMAGVTITWTAPSDIGYGTALDGTQLNATATFGGKDVAGTFVYNPAAGTVLNAGSGQTLAVTFTPTDTQDYNPASGSVEINVGKAPLTVTADNKGITYGDALPAYTGVLLGVVNKDDITAQYASVATGAAGSYPIVPTLVDPDSRLSNYAVTSTEGTLTISMAGVTITWTAPSDIGYGTALDGTQLNATATFSGKDVAGTFVYNPAAGTVLNAGSGQTLAVTFTPTDTQDYNPASGSVEINVGKAPLTVTADNKGITYGDALPAYTGVLLGVVNKDDITAQYASVATGAAGSYPIVPTLVDPDSRLSNYAVTSTEGTLTISMAGVTITWTAPSDIGYGTALDGTQLNATATFGGKDVAGTFVYNPAAGTVLNAGSGQTLAVTFTPTDTQDYNPASGSVEINVGKAPLTVTADNKGITYGDALPAYTGVLLGVVNKDDITAQYASVATGAAGSYPIVPTLVDPDSRLSNYAVTSTEGTLTISMAGVTITWTAPSDIGYGTALDGRS